MASDPSLGELLRKVVSGTQAGAVDVAREGPPSEGEQLSPVEHLPSGDAVPLEGQVSMVSEATVRSSGPLSAPRKVPPVIHGLLPQPPAPHDSLELIPHHDPPGPRPAEASESRRSSVQEPDIVEASAALPPIPEGTLQGMETVPGHGGGEGSAASSSSSEKSPTEERASKNPRLEEPVSTRAPGTPLHRLLRAVKRGRASSDPPEVLPAPPEVARSRSPPTTSSTQPGSEGWTLFAFDEDAMALTLLANRGDEIDVRKLSMAERKLL